MSLQEKLELEQVPLKSDVDVDMPPMIDGETAENEVSIKKKAPCRWFFRKKNGEVTTNNGEIVPEEKKAVCRWWHRKEKTEVTQECENGISSMTVGMNFLDRDEKDLNEYIVMDFTDVFAEPDACHSWKWTWLSANRVYGFTSTTVYKIVASIIAIPIAIIFGIIFGLLSVVGVFVCTPVGRLLSVPGNAVAKAWNFVIRKVMDPIFISIGLLRSPKTDTQMSKTSADLY